ncbi:MAG TPA: hypothetical protein PLI09_25245 [Candidatus Hydrogenedentes bacterium]|nr:hypothetical protein [Candidatus Hydrogenedentota bacterium]
MSIIISFILVRHLTQGMSRTPASNPELIRQATLLRQFSNGLLTLAEEYVQQIPLEAEFPKPGQIQRTSKTFLSKLNELRQHVDDDTLVYLPAYRNLMAALDRIAAMASHPEDKTLRKHALNDILAATEATENYLDSQGVSSLLPDAPKKLSFKNLLQTAPDK